jgi:hypothetical protein
MIKHCRYWASEGQRWKQAIEARKARLARPASRSSVREPEHIEIGV